MTESVNVGSEGRYTIGLIDKDRINYITAMNTERDTYNQSMRMRPVARKGVRKGIKWAKRKGSRKDEKRDTRKAKKKVARRVKKKA